MDLGSFVTFIETPIIVRVDGWTARIVRSYVDEVYLSASHRFEMVPNSDERSLMTCVSITPQKAVKEAMFTALLYITLAVVCHCLRIVVVFCYLCFPLTTGVGY